jgi:hypothetical protein
MTIDNLDLSVFGGAKAAVRSQVSKPVGIAQATHE